MSEKRIRVNTLGLKVGDILTFDNMRRIRARVVALKAYSIRVIQDMRLAQKDNPPAEQKLHELTYRLMGKSVTQNQCMDLWLYKNQTLKQRYLNQQAAVQQKSRVLSYGRKNAWVKDISHDECLFLSESCFRFLRNFFSTYKSTVNESGIFEHVGAVMGTDKLFSLFKECTTASIREDLKRREYGNITDVEYEDPKEVLLALCMHPKAKVLFCRKLIEWLDFAQEQVARWQKKRPDSMRGKFEELRQLFNLSELEYDVLVSATLQGNDKFLGCALFSYIRQLLPSRDMVIRRAHLVGVSESAFQDATKRQSKLRRLGCLDNDLCISDDIMTFVNGLTDTPLVSRYYRKQEEEPLPWSFFGQLKEKHGTLIRQMIEGRAQGRGINILLYGEPGTGKTSFAQALASELGYTAYLIAQVRDLESEKNFKTFRLAAVQICDSQVDPRTSIMIVDEADKILEGAGNGFFGNRWGDDTSMDKGAINDILDTLKTPCIWITNSQANQLDSSNRRRFDYSIPFERLTHTQRRMIWKNTVAKHNVDATVTESMIERFAGAYEVNAGGISLAIRNLSDMLANGTATVADAESVLEGILKPHCKLLNIRDDTAKMAVAQDYSLEGLNIKSDMKLDQIMSAVGRFQTEQATQTQGSADRPRMNLLLSGPPGTGKTEFVKHLGASLNTRVVTRMGSDLLNMFVGGTEQNIKLAFEEASSEKAILFLDEIDGMIQSRERAQHSWQVTQVNELLHQMENFDGVLIGATNFATHLDPATLRRFTFKLEFDCLTHEGKALFLLRMFSSMGVSQLSSSEQRRLQAIPNLTPGDFRTVRQSLYYLASTVTTDLILKGLERESLAKGQPKTSIGFR